MQPSPKPKEELAKAATAIEAMEKSHSLVELEEHWKDFLGRIERVWFKAQAHYGKSPKWNGWKGIYEGQRSSDPLLSYLRSARGADEHTIAEIVESQPGSMTILPGSTGSGTIRNLRIESGVVSAETTGTIKLEFKPDRIRLLPVTNRGVTYTVPTSHLGAAVDPDNVVAIAKAGVVYYEKLLHAADKFFVK